MAQESADVETGLPDLSGLSFGELTEQDPRTFQPSLADFLRRIDEPSQSINGYNPQRLD
ncbi:hypothetical protein Aab01nite_31230 [Paractinoplanes abujensis]|uniref:FXSXX-COOH protein n=1 Tax=Paractinoplanes abujensis TaxID=882441 RepID=A0A7W7D123_9ACTN|nr:hypothetical protein [Actinoplanes abujensis]MBB4697984.1 hypothetical protein [Actinoplanes abujensis]GID19533.1 hypothetical protein Aab01nite_31230 [Actinoplanes abujensis]